MTYHIRRATQADNSAIATFYDHSLPHIDPTQTSWIPGVYPAVSDALSAMIKNELFICLDDDGTVVGSVILNTEVDEAYENLNWSTRDLMKQNLVVHTLITHPKRLKQGIASQMVNFIKAFALKEGMASIQLDTLVDNVPARQLYEKNGFLYVGRHDLPSFDNKGVDDCVFYEFLLEHA